MIIPKLVFAESALWMWLWQLNSRKILEEKDRIFQCWKDEYFAADPATDFNN